MGIDRVRKGSLGLLLALLAGGGSPAAGAGDVAFTRHEAVSVHLASPGAVAVDASGSVFVAEAGRDRVVVFDAAGTHRRTLTGLASPISLAIDRSGRLLVGNARRGAVEIYGKGLALEGRLGSGDGEFGQPSGIAVDGDGTVYVADSRRNRVRIYGADGARRGSIGGGAAGLLQFPTGVACDEARGELIVTDLGDSLGSRGAFGGARVQVFTTGGELRRSFGHFGRGAGLLVKPLGVAVDGLGRVFVGDAYQNVVQVYDRAGSPVGTLHDPGRPLRTPMGVALGAGGGRLYVASLTAGRVDAFDLALPDGSRRLAVSLHGDGQGSVTSSPPGIACPGSCSASFPPGTAVTLAAQPAPGFSFAGWSGACVGAGDCLLTMSRDRTAGSHFTTAAPRRPAPADFNGDGLSDVLWLDRDSRQASIWLLDRDVKPHAYPVAAVPRQRLGGTADAGGDGKADVLWLSRDGVVTLWTMDGAAIAASGIAGAAQGEAWGVEALADFDADGRADVLWRHARTGALRLGTFEGGTLGAPRAVATAAGPGWTLGGVADFDADGRADVLWRHARTGKLRLWFMDGAAVLRSAPAGAVVPQGWRLAGTPDLDGDGRADLLLRRAADGLFSRALTGEAGAGAFEPLGNSPPGAWRYLRSGDYDGDGRGDLLLRHEDTGRVRACLAGGDAALRCVPLGTAPGAARPAEEDES